MAARVTIGVPVRNGESELAGCLACLSGQTFRDLEILVSDNASDDRTGEIVADAMRRDSRIRYVRHERNIGALANFTYVLTASETPYFMWRAFDDLSDAGYVERLVAALDANPGAALAAPRVETLRVQAGRLRVRIPPVPGEGPRGVRALQRWTLRRLQAGWIYGLFRREALLEAKAFIYRTYPFAWAWDFLLLVAMVLRFRIVGVPDAVLTLQLTGAPKEYSSSTLAAERIALVRNYWRVLETLLAEQRLSWPGRLLMRGTFVWHVQRRVAKWPILLRALFHARKA